MNNLQDPRRIRPGRAVIGAALSVFLVLVAWASPAAAQHTYAGMNYGDAYSKMVVVNNDMQNDMISAINRANAARRDMFPELAGASRVTPQEIANLCKPFPCGNEGMANRGGPITQQDIQKLCAPFPCGFEPQGSPQPVQVPPRPPAPRHYPITATDYRPIGARLIPDAVAASAKGDAKTKATIRAMTNQFLDSFEKEGRKNNVANGFGYLAIISVQVATGRELKDSEQQQLIASLNNTFAASPQFSSMSARDKQLATEASVISGGLMAFLYTQGQQTNDPKLKADVRQLADAAVAYFFGVRLR
jgi:hypothetical protein